MTTGRLRPWHRGLAVMLYAGLLVAALVDGKIGTGRALAQGGQPAPTDTTGAGLIPPPRARTLPRTARQASWIVADRFIDRMVDGQPVSFLIGNVYIDRDTVVVRADSARVYRDQQLAKLFGHVRMRQYATRLSCDRADYDRQTQDADFYDNVRVVDGGVLATAHRGEMREQGQLLRLFDDAVVIAPEYTVKADTVVRDRRLDYGEAFGDVRIVDPDASTLVTGRHAVFGNDGTWAEVDREPVLTTREEGGEPATSTSRRMRFYRAEERVVMTDSVRMHQGRMRAQADTAVAFGKERMLLLGHPEVAQGETSHMRGDRITFFYHEGRLVRVVLVGKARMEDAEPDSLAAIYRGLPSLDIVEGDSITVHFDAGKIARTVVIGSAHSLYVPIDVDEEVAFNEVYGDTMVIGFRGGRVRKVDVRGQMHGTYHFARIAAMTGPARPDTAQADTTAAAPDSVAIAPSDSLPVAAAAADTTVADFKGHEETVVYSGQAVAFDLSNMTIEVTRDAKLVYGDMTLTAKDVQLDTRTRELYASGEPLLEQNEKIAGERMGYDFANKTGAVLHGVTTFDQYYYVGDEIFRYPDGSLKIHGGRMTSCDLARPHYHFWADKMKMRLGDQVVAAPIVMKVGKVPVFALPFYFKSLKQGRRSGILFPNFNVGWSSRTGRYIRDLGYFWATNDYTDFTFEVDYNEHQDLSTRVRNRIVKRYSFSTNFDYTRRTSLRPGNDLREWQFQANHDQPHLFDDYTFHATASMASKTLTSNDLNQNVGRDILQGSRKSSLSISRRYGWGGTSLSGDRTEQLNPDDNDPATNNEVYNMTLPSMSISPNQLTLARSLPVGQKGSFLGDLGRSTYLSQSYTVRNAIVNRELTNLHTYAAQGSWTLRVQPPRVGLLNLNASATGGQRWQRDVLTGQVYVAPPDSLSEPSYVTLDSVRETRQPNLGFSTGANTTLYGIFPVHIGNLRAIRHTLGLKASANFTPQLGSKQRRSQSYSFAMTNRFDVKYATSDSARTEKKLDGLIDWSLSTSYNPQATNGRLWSAFNSGLRLKPGSNRNLALQVNNTFDPYLRRITYTQLNYGFGFRGRLDTGWSGKQPEAKRNAAIERLGATAIDSAAAVADSLALAQQQDDPFAVGPNDDFYSGFQPNFGEPEQPGGQRDPTEGGRYIPWTLSGSLTYNHSASIGGATTGSSTARASVSIETNLTRDWQLQYTASFDLESGMTTRQEYRLQRDLHCWRLEFNRVLSTVDSQFGFRFYLKAIPELKLTQGKEDLMGRVSSLTGLP